MAVSWLRALLAVVTIALGVWHIAAAALNPPEVPPEDMVSPALAVYRGLAIDLPASGEIGFLPTGANDTFNAGNYFAAQYALAPRVLRNPYAGVRFVITGVDAPAAIDQDPRLNGFTLAAVRDRGVRIYRRSDP